MGKRVALALLDEIFSGSAVDSANQPYALMLMSLASDDSICSIKIGRITQQSIQMLKNIKAFINVQFKIEEVEDDVYSDDSSDDDKAEGDEESDSGLVSKQPEKSEKSKLEFPKSFIFSCIGVGLTNIARKTE